MRPEDWISVKDRLPVNGDRVLVHTEDEHVYEITVSSGLNSFVDAWMPFVPPPKPDPFETWWWAKVNTSAWGNDVKEVCRRAWDAALKSKEQGE